MNSARDLLAQGNAEEALAQTDAILAREPQNVEALLLRSTLRTRQGEASLALADAEQAVRLSSGSEESQLRRAISLWRLREYGKAKAVARLLGDGQAATIWKAMIQAHEEPEQSVDRIPPAPTPTAAPQSLQNQAPRMEWYQGGDTVHVMLYRKGLNEANAVVKISERNLIVTSDDFEWTQKLGRDVDLNMSRYEITPFKVEFVLYKQKPAHWRSLASESEEEPTVVPPQNTAPQQAVTSYSKWEHIDVDDDEEESKESGDPNAFFQQLYKSSTPEVQRAMMKSFVESNGTALSTNWDEVKKGKVETHPPKDMEPRGWS